MARPEFDDLAFPELRTRGLLVGGPAGNVEPVRLSRFASIDCPDEVQPDADFSVTVSLTEAQLSTETKVEQGTTTPDGQLQLDLPDQQQESWAIDVVLSAPGFSFRDGRNTSQIDLPRNGDSTPALFHLRAKPEAIEALKQRLTATLWHDGAYLAKISRQITVVADVSPRPTSLTVTELASPSQTSAMPGRDEPQDTVVDLSLRSPDLTIFLLTANDPTNPDRSELIIDSPHLQPTTYQYDRSRALAPWLDTYYASFSVASARGAARAEEEGATPEAQKDKITALLKGFGKELYQKFAPAPFKEAFWRLMETKGTRFKTIQIFTDDPVLPWELMRPVRPDGSDEQDFLGVQFRIARWHVSRDFYLLDRPPQSIDMHDLVVVSPRYTGQDALAYRQQEIDELSRIRGYRLLPGTFDAIKTLFGTLPAGIIHFAGHGVMRDTSGGIMQYAIRLEDGDLDLTTWKGLLTGAPAAHPFIIFNACDVGQSQRVANFVNGWAPAVLEAGASGYIGGLWPLGDKGAAEFSTTFYETLDQRVSGGRAVVSDLMRKTRAMFYDTGDPTFLAYVFYGDPFFAFTGPQSGAQR